jgi:hypothetical protein
MATASLDPKIPNEVIYARVDFSKIFDTGVLINSATVTATRYGGTADASPSSIISGTAAVSGMIVSQLIVGGVAGTVYLLKFVANGNDGTVNDVELLLPVLAVRLG